PADRDRVRDRERRLPGQTQRGRAGTAPGRVDDEGAGRLVGVAEIDGAGAAAWGVAGGAEAARGRDPGGIEAGEVARIDRDAAAATEVCAAGANRAGAGQLPDVDPDPAAGAGAPQIGFGAVGQKLAV